MRRVRKWHLALTVMASFQLVFPFWANAAEPTSPALLPLGRVGDVGLQSDGSLTGSMVDKAGRAMADREVRMANLMGQELARTRTDAAGRFRITGLRGGVYQIASPGSLSVYRCWAHRTAPPTAAAEILLVEGGRVERGQQPFGMIFQNPLVIGGLIAAGVAIPIAIHNSGDDGS